MHIITFLVVVQLSVILFGAFTYLLSRWLNYWMAGVFIWRWRAFKRRSTTATVNPVKWLSTQPMQLQRSLFNCLGVKKSFDWR